MIDFNLYELGYNMKILKFMFISNYFETEPRLNLNYCIKNKPLFEEPSMRNISYCES